MRARGHKLLLAAPSDTQIYKRCRDDGFEVFDFSDRALLYPWSILRLACFLRNKRVDIVNTHSSRDGWIAGLAARLIGAPLLIRSRHIDVDYKGRMSSRIAFKWLPHRVITTSERIREGLINTLGLDPQRVQSIPTGIDTARFAPGSDDARQEARASFGLNSNPTRKLVGVVAVLRSWKGHAYFLKAAKRLAQKREDIDFVLAGDGPKRNEIERQIAELGLKDRVRLLGHVERVEEIFTALDIAVLPSIAHEGIPQSLLQAMAMQKPVIGTDAGGIAEIIEHERTGLLVPPKNAEALASSIERLIENPSLADRIARAGHQQIIEKHSMDIMCEKLEKLYARA